jgi:hypothetical protein
MHDAVTDFLRASHTCLFLAHPEIRRLESAAGELIFTYSWPHLSLGRELGAVLLSETPQRRARSARQWLPVRLGEMTPGPALCTEIDLLFEPTLELDPLRLLSDVSRIARLVVLWPGHYTDDALTYAVPEHSHYRAWRRPGVPVAILG